MGLSLDHSQRTANPSQALSLFETLEPVLSGSRTQMNQTLLNGLLSVWGNCNFLARWSRRESDKIPQIIKMDLKAPWGDQDYRNHLEESLQDHPPKDIQSFSKLIIDFKYIHFFRITLRDLGYQKPFAEIAGEISSLARVILQKSSHFIQEEMNSQWGFPTYKTKAKEGIEHTVLGLGKLGGNELNYSSDVDLIYFYGSDEGKVPKKEGQEALSVHEYFTKLSEKLTGFLNQKTMEGFLYRVDLDLRPEGKAGPLTNSVDAMEDYYEFFGADWEKQALIKASFAAGSRALFNDFIQRIHPFLYSKIRDFSFLPRLKEMKEKVLESVQKSSQQGYHVKLGKGGIREIEFFVQSFQILFGGNYPDLQKANTLEAIHSLAMNKFISPTEQKRLSEAYIYLRTLENRLQQVEEQQTHRLPESQEELLGMSRRMGYFQTDPTEALNSMVQDLEYHRSYVEQMFKNLLAAKLEELKK